MIHTLTRALLLALAGSLICLPAAPAQAQRRSTSAPADNATRLNALYGQYWDALMKLDPLQATLQGDARYNDQLPNTLSLAFRQQYIEFNQEWLARAQAIGDAGLQGQDLLSYQVFVRDTRAALAGRDHPAWMLPVNSYYNPATIIALLGSGAGAQPFNTVKDYENWSRRSLGIPTLFNQTIDNMRQGIAAGVVQPRALMEKVLPQLDAVLAAGSAEDSLFWGPVRNMPDDFSDADRQRLSAEYRRMIDNRILPAYRALRGFIATEYLPACRDSDGLGALPGGAAWYAHNIQQYTTIAVAPEQLHQMASAEVTRLQEAMTTTMRSQRIRGKREKMVSGLYNDRSHVPAGAQALVDAYRQAHSELAAPLAAVVPELPLAPLQIAPLEPTRVLTASAVSYQPPAANDQPGMLWINTSELAQRPRWAVTQLYLHEAIPGHHLQLGLRQEGAPLPRFRRHTGDTAFVEGWGLYAEALGQELGLYDQPAEQLGYLHTNVVRNARIVADTGLHAQGWSRQQAVQYLIKQADMRPADAAVEVERSLAMPGQALSAGAGLWQLLKLREQAQAALGANFDLRQFHAQVLRDGSLPMDILQAKIQRWIDSVAADSPAPTTPAPSP